MWVASLAHLHMERGVLVSSTQTPDLGANSTEESRQPGSEVISTCPCLWDGDHLQAKPTTLAASLRLRRRSRRHLAWDGDNVQAEHVTLAPKRLT